MANKRTIRLLSDSHHDQLVMKSLLHIVGNRASTNWVYPDCDGYDSTNTDVIFIDTDVMSNADISTLKLKYDARLVVAYGAMIQKPASFDFLLAKPMRAKDLLLLLNDLEAKLAECESMDDTVKLLVKDVKQTIPSDASTPQKNQTPTLHSTKLIDKLLVLSKQSEITISEVRINGQVYAYLDNYRKKAFVNPLFLKEAPVGVLSSRAMESMPQNHNFKAVTFTDLFFELTLAQPPAALVEGLSTEDTFYIKQWPNMGNSSNAKNLVRIAAYFSKQHATLAKATRDLSIEANQVVSFINAVHSQNLLMYVPTTSVVPKVDVESKSEVVVVANSSPKEKKSGIGGLFGRIRQRLGI